MSKPIMIMEMKPRKFREEDQFFMVGDYNVTFYVDSYVNKGNEYYMLIISKFRANTEIARVRLYVKKLTNYTYSQTWEKLHNEAKLSELITYKENSRFAII